MTAFLTLAEAAKLIPGADENTLKRMQRAGKLTCYRPGKAYLTTAADIMESVKQSCRVVPKVRDSGYVQSAETHLETSPTSQAGLSSTELASLAAASEVKRLKEKKKKR